MIICVVKSTQKLIGSQDSPTAGTLIQNAINAGYNETDIEEKEVTEAEFQAILDAEMANWVNPDQELADAISAATTLSELKAALLGNGGVARVKGKRK